MSTNNLAHQASEGPLPSADEMFRLLVASVKDYAIFMLDPSGRVISWNSGAEEIYGYTPDEIIGRPCSTFYTADDVDRGVPDHSLEIAAARGKSRNDGLRVRKDGSRFWASTVISAIADETGQLRGYAKVTRDITARKRMEDAMRQAEERFDAFMANLPGIAWIKDSAGRYLYANRNLEERTGYSFIGKTDEELWPKVAAELRANDQRVLSSGKPLQTIEKSYDQNVIWLVSKFPICTADSVMVGGVAVDITKRVQAEEELANIRKELFKHERARSIDELASGLAHDLNNTLNAIKLRLAILKADPACAPQRTNIDALDRFIGDAAARIGQLQDFAREHRDRPLESVDLGQIVREAVEMVHSEVEGKPNLAGIQVRIANELPEPLPAVVGIASDLRHVFANLFLNARDAMPNGGVIHVGARPENGRVLVTVADEGSGVSEQHLLRIFDPFFSTKDRHGTGLGLSMAREVMARLGGDITAANRAEGGAVFTLSFSIASRKSQQPVAQAAIAPTGRRVLVIDDDADNLEALHAALAIKGHIVETASTGAEGSWRIRMGSRYDVVICDIGMPGMNGWEVAQVIVQFAPGTRIYLLTGWAREIARDDPRRKLVAGVLAKPVDLEHINSLIAQ